DLPPLSPRQRAMVETATRTIQSRLDQAPIAFRLLPGTFTLSELQQMYELLLGKRLHKASFRRALQAAWLVEPTDEWRSEGRGRPFSYAGLSGQFVRSTARTRQHRDTATSCVTRGSRPTAKSTRGSGCNFPRRQPQFHGPDPRTPLLL